MSPSDVIALSAVAIALFGGIFGFMWRKVDERNKILENVLEVKDKLIEAKDKTIESQDRQILLLESTATATNNLMKTVRFVVQGGESP